LVTVADYHSEQVVAKVEAGDKILDVRRRIAATCTGVQAPPRAVEIAHSLIDRAASFGVESADLHKSRHRDMAETNEEEDFTRCWYGRVASVLPGKA